MANRVPIDTYCEKTIETLSATYDDLIDYIDISSVDNVGKKIVSVQTIDARGAPSRAKQLLKKGDVIVSTVRPNLNAVAIVEDETENLMVGSTGYCVLRCTKSLDARYLFNFCQSQYFIDDMSSQATGASYPAVSTGIVRSSLIPWRSIEEQRKIAEKLNFVGRLISLRKQQITKLDELVKARFVEMFGTLTTTIFSVKTLDELCVFIKDGTHQTPTYTEDTKNGIKFLSSKDVTNGRIDWTRIKYIPQDLHKKLYTRIAPQRGDILLAKNGTTGIPAIVDTDDVFDIYVSLALLRFKTGNNVIYLWAALSALETKRQFDSSLKGIGVPNLHLSEIKKIKIIVPPIELQDKFSWFVGAMNRQRLTIQQSLDKLEVLKKSLMQEYFG